MMLRRLMIAGLLMAAASPVAALTPSSATDDVRVTESAPAANAHIGRKSSAFFVRFDRPVDHIKSTLVIKQGDKVIERLHPRLESAPEVLFAAAPTLPPGDYMLHWTVITRAGNEGHLGRHSLPGLRPAAEIGHGVRSARSSHLEDPAACEDREEGDGHAQRRLDHPVDQHRRPRRAAAQVAHADGERTEEEQGDAVSCATPRSPRRPRQMTMMAISARWPGFEGEQEGGDRHAAQRAQHQVDARGARRPWRPAPASAPRR